MLPVYHSFLLNMKARSGYAEWYEDIPEGYDHLAEMSLSQQERRLLPGKLNASSLDWTDEVVIALLFPQLLSESDKPTAL